MYKAATGEETVPIEIDISRVTRSREYGVLRLGQPLKSFRDRNVDFSIYQKGKTIPYLDSLGPLKKQSRLDKIGEAIESPQPELPYHPSSNAPSSAPTHRDYNTLNEV
jgi:hypothetical protein